MLDIEATNESEATRWLLIPMQLPLDEGGVFAVETLAAAQEPAVVFARALGLGGRLAFRIEARQSVRLSDVSITWWGDEPKEFDVPLEFAHDATLGGIPLERWFAQKPTEVGARDGAVNVGAARLAGSKATEGRETVPLALKDGEVVTLHVARDPIRQAGE